MTSMEVDRICGRAVTPQAVARYSNCTLKAMRQRLSEVLATVEDEMDRRMIQKEVENGR